jgi:hypothetical protein
MVGVIAALGALPGATAAARPLGPDQWKRCNDIYGSPLCITITGKFNEQAHITVEYTKHSGPDRDVSLYVQRCVGGKPVLVARDRVGTDNVALSDTIRGTKVRDLKPNSCWIGIMRVLNMRFVTGELTAVSK